MSGFNRKAFIELTGKYLASKLDASMTAEKYREVNERVVRYYHFDGILDKPGKSEQDAREAEYSKDHVKQFIAIRLLQVRGASLEQIRHKIKNVEAVISQGAPLGISMQDIDSFIQSNETNLQGETKSAEAEQAPPAGQKAKKEETVMSKTVAKRQRKPAQSHDGRIRIQITNQQE